MHQDRPKVFLDQRDRVHGKGRAVFERRPTWLRFVRRIVFPICGALGTILPFQRSAGFDRTALLVLRDRFGQGCSKTLILDNLLSSWFVARTKKFERSYVNTTACSFYDHSLYGSSASCSR